MTTARPAIVVDRLQIGIQGHHQVAASGRESGGEGRGLAEVAAKLQPANASPERLACAEGRLEVRLRPERLRP